MSIPDAACLAVKGFVAPLLLWRGWQNNKSEVERLREFLDYGQGLLSDVEHLAVEDFEDLQIDLTIVHTDFLNLQRKPAVLRGSGYKQYAEELTVLKRRVEEVARRFGQKLNIDTSKKMSKIERYQRKLLRESQQTRDMLREMKQEQIETPGGTSSDMVKPLVKEITSKIEENLRLNKDAEDALARAKQAERDLEEQVRHNARLRESLESARLEVARCQGAVGAAEVKAAKHESVSAKLEKELRTLRGQVTAARRRLQALDDDLARSNDRVKEAKARIREVEKEMENKQKAISVSYARLKELRAWSSNRKAAADHDMVEFKTVAEARFQEQVEENGLLRGTVEKLTIEVQALKKELKESREEVVVLTQLLQLGDPVASPEDPPAARPGPATRHGKEEGLSARPDQSKTRSGAAAAAGGAAATAAEHSKDGNHKQTPAPYYTIPAGVDHNSRNTAVDGNGHPDSFQQAGRTVTVKQGESIQVALDSASPGTIIMIEAGMYFEFLKTKVDGTKEQPITLKGPSSGPAAIINASGTSSLCIAINHDFYILDNLWIDGMADEQPLLKTRAIDICVCVEGNRKPRWRNGELYLSSVDGIIIKNLRIYNFRYQGIWVRHFATNCTLLHNCIASSSLFWAIGIVIGDSSNFNVVACHNEMNPTGLDICRWNRVCENYIRATNGGCSILEGAMDTVIETNYVTGGQPITERNGINCRASSSVIRYNKVLGWDGVGVYLGSAAFGNDQYVTPCKVYCNILEDNKAGGIELMGEGNQICQNIITGKGSKQQKYKAIFGIAANSYGDNAACPFHVMPPPHDIETTSWFKIAKRWLHNFEDGDWSRTLSSRGS